MKSTKAFKAFLVLVIMLVLVACVGVPVRPVAVSGQTEAVNQTNRIAGIAGLVPVVIINPSPGLIRHLFLFEGHERVELIPDARTGGWMFNRPAISELVIEPARDVGWHTELWLLLPRNMNFTIYDQAERFWGARVGRPHVVGFRTGSDPVSHEYYRRSPLGGRIPCGGVVHLPYEDPRGPSQLRIHITWEPAPFIIEGMRYGIHQLLTDPPAPR